jgi:hypothetical protein
LQPELEPEAVAGLRRPLAQALRPVQAVAPP